MSDDPTEHAQEHIQHEAAHGGDHGGGHGPKWITIAALTAAFLAAFAAVSSSLATSHLTDSTLTRIEANDTWNEYQSKSIKKYIIDTHKLEVALAGPANATAPAVIKQQKSDAEKIAEYNTKIEDDNPEDPKGTLGLGAKATKLQDESKVHLETHETYELSATMFHIAIAVVAIAVVAKRKEFWYMSMVGGVVGLFLFGTAAGIIPKFGLAHEGGSATEPAATEHVVSSSAKAAGPAESRAGEHAPAGTPIETH